jgi:hypothetical protein
MLRDGLRHKELILLPFYPAFRFAQSGLKPRPTSSLKRERTAGTYWAKFATRLTALSVGAMGWNARRSVMS